MPVKYSLNDIHEESFTETLNNKLKKDVLEFSEKKGNTFVLQNICPACQSQDIRFEFKCLDLDYCQCKQCLTIFVNPCPSAEQIIEFLNTSEALKIWREYMPKEMQLSRNKLYESRAQLIRQQVKHLGIQQPVLVEVGGGRGELSSKLDDLKLFRAIHVVEPQELKLSSSNIRLHRCTFEELQLGFEVDCIVSFEVLEHLINPIEFLKKAYTLLKPGGILILTTPNGSSFEVELLRDKSTQIPFDHIRLYNPTALKIMLDMIGSWDITISTPGVFDVDLLEKALSISNNNVNDCLEFILSDQDRKEDFQTFLVNNNRSSHMRCIAKKNT